MRLLFSKGIPYFLLPNHCITLILGVAEAGGRRHGGGAAGVGGCARLPSSAAGMRSVSSTRLRCARTLWAVSGNPSGIPGSTMGLATGTSARLRAGHDVCRAPGSAARWGRAGRKLADARGRCGLLRGRDHSRTRLHQGHSTRPWHVIDDGLRVPTVGQRQCRPERGIVTTARPSAERLQRLSAIVSHLQTFHDVVKRTQTTGMPPHPPPPVVCVRAANVRARAYAHGHVCARMRVGVGVRVCARMRVGVGACACVGSTYS